MKRSATGWSARAQWITKITLTDIRCGYFLLPSPTLHFKHWEGSYATASVAQLQAGILCLTDTDGRQLSYASPEELLAAGWVID